MLFFFFLLVSNRLCLFIEATTGSMMMAMMMFEATAAVRFPSVRAPSPEELAGVRSSSLNLNRDKWRRIVEGRCRGWRSRARASTGSGGSGLSSSSDRTPKVNGRTTYHPFEEIAVPVAGADGADVRLTPSETARTIVEVNSKANLVLSGVYPDGTHENILWPDLSYVTGEHGNVYLEVGNDQDVLPTLTSENNFVQAVIGFDNLEMLDEMRLQGFSEIDFGIRDIEIEGSIEDNDDEEDDDDDDDDDDDEDDDDLDDDYDEDYDVILEGDDDDSDESLGDWSKLETMRYTHPKSFARKLTEATTDNPVDGMERPSAGLILQSIIRPAFIEEHSDIQRHMSSSQSTSSGTDQAGEKIEGKLEDLKVVIDEDQKLGPSEDGPEYLEELEKVEAPRIGTSFYKLEMIKILLISANGSRTAVDVEDFKKAQPDAVALSASKIISRVKAGGEKMTEAFKSLCRRCMGIIVEDAVLAAIDSLGFDLRVCSGTQIQTLRFTFVSRATSVYSAEKQLNDLLFPIHHTQPVEKKEID